jgi:tetratricopeptide (TPR) repeat protein
VAAVAAAGWALYKHFSKPPEVKPAITGVQIGGSVSAGRDVVINNINQNFPQEQFDALLQKRLKEILAQIPQADPQQRALLERELAAIKAKHDNLQQAFEEQKAKLAEAYQALDQFKQQVPAGQIEQAQKALAQGQTGAAEKLFQQALEKRTAEAAEAAYQLGRLAESRVDYGQAEKYYRQALQLQPDNPVYLNAAGKLSWTLGHYPESEKLLKRALELREKSLKPDDPDIGQSLNNLALLYEVQEKYSEAEPLFRRALAIWEKSEHPDVVASLNNLAALYYAQGRYGEAEPLYRRALAILEKTPEHPKLAVCLDNLAVLYRVQGRYGESEPLHQRALAIGEKALGPEHPDVATCLKNYAALLKKVGRGAEAEPLEARAKAIRAKHAEKNPQK